jgi:hypothetical protein
MTRVVLIALTRAVFTLPDVWRNAIRVPGVIGVYCDWLKSVIYNWLRAIALLAAELDLAESEL